MSDANWAIFGGITMYRSLTDTSNNMEYLFDLPDPVTGAEPATSSLFNSETMKTLVTLGQAAPNIISAGQSDLTYGTDFTLP